MAGGLGFEAALLNQVEERGQQRDHQRGVGGQQKHDVEEYPAGADGSGESFLPRAEGCQHGEHEGDRQDEDSQRDAAVPRVDDQKSEREDKRKQRLDFVGLDRKTMVGGVKRLGERYEVEESCGYGGGDGEATPAWAVVERRGQHREGCYAVQDNRESEPEESHGATLQYIRRPLSGGLNVRAGHTYTTLRQAGLARL
jgi:hypothetical protein